MEKVNNKSSVALKRIIWKRPPNDEDILVMRMGTLFGPSCFRRGGEWLFIWGDEEFCRAETPNGYERIN